MHMLEHTTLNNIVKESVIYFDPDDMNTLIQEDAPLLSQYKEFENMMEECGAATISVKGGENQASKWILRLTLNVETMLEKNITMDDIHFTLQNIYGESVSCVFADYNDDNLVCRIRLNKVIVEAEKNKDNRSPLDQSDHIYMLKNFQKNMLNNVVMKGVKGIKNVFVRPIQDMLVERDGAYKTEELWVLDTTGTNLLDVLRLDYIDNTRTFSNDIMEVFDVLGIEAARQLIYNEIADVIEFDGTYVDAHHMYLLCDRMSFNSKLTAVSRHGINNDDIGPIAKASFEETPEMFLNAAIHAELDAMTGTSANVMCGQEGSYGTSSFQVMLDLNEMNKLDEMVQVQKTNDEQTIHNELFDDLENPNDSCGVTKLLIENNVVNIHQMDMGTMDASYDAFA